MNQNTWFLLTVVLGVVIVSIFFYLIYLKVKLTNRRRELQKAGLIDDSFKTLTTGAFEIVFWMLPVFIKYGVRDDANKKIMHRINLLWLIMIACAAIVIKI